MNSDLSSVESGPESPLRITVVDGELVIRVGINRLDGNENHPNLPAFKFVDRVQWAEAVARELQGEAEDGSTRLTDLLDSCMAEAIEGGAPGLAEDSPICRSMCVRCGELCVVTMLTLEPVCPKCLAGVPQPGGTGVKGSPCELSLDVLKDYPVGTACIRYRESAGAPMSDWFVSASQFDDETTLRKHLAKYKPRAVFVGWCNKVKPDEPR